MTGVSIASLILIAVIILLIILRRLLCIHQAQFVSEAYAYASEASEAYA